MTEKSLLREDSLVPLMHHDPRDFGLILRFFKKKKQDWILKLGFCVSLLNRLIQDHSDHGASREFVGSFDAP